MNKLPDDILEIKQRFEKALPGEEAQMHMAPSLRMRVGEYLKKGLVAKDASVLVILKHDVQGELSVVLTRRQKDMGAHSNQISFPGGKMQEEDVSKFEAALREAEEEIGIRREKYALIGSLTQLYIPVSNFLVSPFVVYSFESETEYALQEKEVAGLYEQTFSKLFHSENKGVFEVTTSYGSKIRAPYYGLHEHKIWGATAMMLSEVECLLRDISLLKEI